ncbi:MAG: hypothetical protein J0H68_09430 [Sphingobacteriia bacterium]|nr:hypothetical protein [Sphingobacteriia bacterium]
MLNNIILNYKSSFKKIITIFVFIISFTNINVSIAANHSSRGTVSDALTISLDKSYGTIEKAYYGVMVAILFMVGASLVMKQVLFAFVLAICLALFSVYGQVVLSNCFPNIAS